MRRVVVRVTEEGDWEFRAEREDGRLIFNLQYTEEGTAAPPEDPTELAPEPPTKNMPYHKGEFGMMLGAPDDDWVNSLYTLRNLVDLALPTPNAGARVVEIGAGSGETTVAYSHGWKGVDHWLVDPGPDTFSLLTLNKPSFPLATIVTEPAIELAGKMSKQDLTLLIVSPRMDRKSQVEIIKAWLPHLLPGGKMILRMPNDGTPVSMTGWNVDQSGEWLLYSPAEMEGDDE